MFGHNSIVGRKFFREHPEARAGKLLVTSVFPTLQGEGPLAGIPAVFVRLAYCQLRCEMCDTFFDRGDWFFVNDLLDTAVVHPTGTVRPDLLVVTGGEPTLQPNLRLLLEDAHARGFRTQIETNGLLDADVPAETVVVVSPKPAQSGQPGYRELPLKRADCLKFVLSGDPASLYHEVPRWAVEWQAMGGRELCEIYVSPMAEYRRTPEQARAAYEARRAPSMEERTAAERVSFWEPGLLDMDKCRRNYEYAALYAIKHGLRLTIQQHLFASLP